LANKALAQLLVALLTLPTLAIGAVAPRRGTPKQHFAPLPGAGSLAPADEATRARVEAGLGKMPLYFVENRGQIDSRVRYYVQGASNSVYFTKTGIVFKLTSRVGGKQDGKGVRPAAHAAGPSSVEPASIQHVAIRLDFEGANPDVKVVGHERTPAVVSYFSAQPSEQKTGLPTFAGVVYEELWPGIDLVYGSESGRPKYSFVVKPGADPNRIRLVYRGVSGVRLTEAGRLEVQTPAGSFGEDRPYAYQERQGETKTGVAAAFEPEAEAQSGEYRFGFRVGAYDRTLTLVLDPIVLAYCGYIGGTDFEELLAGGIAVDTAGNAYVTSSTWSDGTTEAFPVVAGSWNTTNASQSAFVAKVNAAGTALVYCGYLGGGYPSGIAVDGSGNAYVTGRTTGGIAATAGSWDTTFQGGSFDGFLTKINAAGTAIVYSGYIGGGNSDQGEGVAVDGSGNAYVVGYTTSLTSGSPANQFPVVAGSWDVTYSGGSWPDAFVTKINAAGTARVYSGLLGGTNPDEGRAIAVDGSGNAYIMGYTSSDPASGFQVVAGSWDITFGGSADAFAAKINPAGTALVYSGYIGGSGLENTSERGGIAVDGSGNAYVVGNTNSTPASGFPVVAGSWDITYNTNTDTFVTKINPAGTALVYSGYIGGSDSDYGRGIAVDGSGNAYVTGWTASTETDTVPFPVTAGPDLTYNGGWNDVYVAKINAAGSALVYCGYIGGTNPSGNDDETPAGIAVDGSGNAYVFGQTDSLEASFPETVGPDLTYNGPTPGYDNFVAKISSTNPFVAYSVGTSYPSDLKSGSPTLTLVAGAATFSVAQPNNIGVGDEVTYSGSTKAYISGRVSSTVYSVLTATGGVPADVTGATVNSITRAFGSLTAALAGSSNASHLNTSDLVAADKQLHLACYNDGPMNDGNIQVDGYTTGPANYLRIFTPTPPSEVGSWQRHVGRAGTGFRLRHNYAAAATESVKGFQINDDYVRIEGIAIDASQVTGFRFFDAINADSGISNTASDIRIDTVLIHDIRNPHEAGSLVTDDDSDLFGIHIEMGSGQISNSIIYGINNYQNIANGSINTHAIRWGTSSVTPATWYVYNNTVFDIKNLGTTAGESTVGVSRSSSSTSTKVVKNTVALDVEEPNVPGSGQCFASLAAFTNPSNNVSSDATAPGTASQLNKTSYATYFKSVVAGSENLHLLNDSNTLWGSYGADLDGDPNLPIADDVDGSPRNATQPDIGADEFYAATAVALSSFAATGADSAVELAWQTGSELSNLGFHVYRAMSEAGPFTRITASLVAGLGSSPQGARYSYRDAGLVNGRVYYYKLEDVETTGISRLHGPVWATPVAAVSTTPPTPAAEPAAGPARVSYGDPSKVGLRVVERGANGVVLELRTGGFFAEPLADGTVRLSVPGFETLSAPGLASLPVERTMLEARVGRQVRIASVQPLELMSFSSLRPEDAGAPEVSVGRDGTVRPTRRRTGRRSWVGAYPESAARIVSVGFQGETKKALLELCPLRWDEGSGQLLLAQRLRVEVVFAGREAEESGQGSRGRRVPRDKGSVSGVVARLSTLAAGLHAVSFEQVLPGSRRGVMASELSLSRLGAKVAFHISPDANRFAPGSQLYFVSVGPDANPEGNEAVYELSLGQLGLVMAATSAAPAGSTLIESTAERTFELNRYYLSSVGTPWLWEYVRWGERKSLSFSLTQVSSGAPGRIEIALQGVSDYPVSPDHHIRVSLNGTFLGEVSWDGKLGQALVADVPAGVLREGQNALELENLPDTAAGYSLVYLDRFKLRYSQALQAEAGRFEGSFAYSGEARLAGLAAGAVLLDTTGRAPVWLMGAVADGQGLGFRAEAGHGYLAVSPEAVLAPDVRVAASSTLRAVSNQADYLLLAPRAFLTEAEVLLEHRRDQGLSARGVAIEEIYEEFGHGEGGPQAIRDFLAHAYHHWSAPSPRYVLLLGDASYDTKDYLGLHRQNLLPTPQVLTSYLWTASDPALASLNGEDGFPDIALGRLSASTAEEARTMIGKILAWESAGFTPLAGPATLVADNPDPAGDFESDAEEIAQGWLGGREVERIYLSQLGTLNARSAVKGAFERGTSLVSYIGHGSTTLWASEQMLNPGQVDALASQAQQPLVLAMNCLNGFFQTPWSDSLAEKLVKAEDKGAIAAFSSSGMSLNEASKVYHKAMLDQILHGTHERLGDALLAAQSAYADSGADPEMLAIYHLLGDPALRIK